MGITHDLQRILLQFHATLQFPSGSEIIKLCATSEVIKDFSLPAPNEHYDQLKTSNSQICC